MWAVWSDAQSSTLYWAGTQRSSGDVYPPSPPFPSPPLPPRLPPRYYHHHLNHLHLRGEPGTPPPTSMEGDELITILPEGVVFPSQFGCVFCSAQMLLCFTHF